MSEKINSRRYDQARQNRTLNEKDGYHEKKAIIIPMIIVPLLLAAGAAGIFLYNRSDGEKSSSKSGNSSIGEIYAKDIEEEHIAFYENDIGGYIDNEILVITEDNVL